ncbi:MAG: hypothetical protein EOP87_17615, partial [Verrucomicrobiaceae bacterium]
MLVRPPTLWEKRKAAAVVLLVSEKSSLNGTVTVAACREENESAAKGIKPVRERRYVDGCFIVLGGVGSPVGSGMALRNRGLRESNVPGSRNVPEVWNFYRIPKKSASGCDISHRRHINEVVTAPADAIPQDEPDLIRRAQRGELAAFGTLVGRYQGSVRAFAALRMSVRCEAEDLAQETFVIAWRKLADFDPETSLGAWLRRIAHHLVRNHRRKFRAEGVGGYQELEILWRGQERERPGGAED